jgi:hypothetical protein
LPGECKTNKQYVKLEKKRISIFLWPFRLRCMF